MSNATASFPQHILCLVDGSEEGCRAAHVAGCLARDLSSRLSFVVAAKPVKPTPELESYLVLEGLTGVEMPLPEAEAEACLQTALTIARDCDVPDPLAQVKIGTPYEIIAEYQRAEAIDMVVLGHAQWPLLARATQRPLAGRIIENLKLPVTLVP
ncbi:MAG: universal stress protein [Pseudomonadota bacterium]